MKNNILELLTFLIACLTINIENQKLFTEITFQNVISWAYVLPDGQCCGKTTIFGSCTSFCHWNFVADFRFPRHMIFTKNQENALFLEFDLTTSTIIYNMLPNTGLNVRFDSGYQSNFLGSDHAFYVDPLNQPYYNEYRCFKSIGAVNFKLESSCVDSYGSNCHKPCNSRLTCYDDGTYKCKNGFYGTDCLNTVIYCNSQLCMNGGACIEPTTSTTSKCACPLGYTGQFCELIDYVFSGICGNGGVVAVNGGIKYCKCNIGFYGKTCSPTCEKFCLNGGVCSIVSGSPRCTCPLGFSMNRCQKKSCLYNCMNGGNCDVNTGRCVCRTGFSGPACTLVTCNTATCIRTCNSNLCVCNDPNLFGILCDLYIPVPNQCPIGNETLSMVANVLNVQCPCPANKYGKRCHLLLENNQYCNGNGLAIKESKKGFTCQCNSGWTGPNCNQLVALPNCQNGVLSGLECLCNIGWSGPDCSLQKCDSLNCINGVCQNGNCLCNQGFSGTDCTIKYCNNLCQHGTCDLKINKCQCEPEYIGDYCENRQCLANSCSNNGRCLIYKDSLMCFCNLGFEGVRCEKEINLCQPNPCINNGICTKLPDKIHCQCPYGVTGSKCELIHQGCDSTEFKCKNDGICVQLTESSISSCECASGFTGEHCELVDLCLSNPCHNGQCIQNHLQIQCDCYEGYAGNHCDYLINSASYIKIESGRLYAIVALIVAIFVMAICFTYKTIKSSQDIVVSKGVKKDNKTLENEPLALTKSNDYNKIYNEQSNNNPSLNGHDKTSKSQKGHYSKTNKSSHNKAESKYENYKSNSEYSRANQSKAKTTDDQLPTINNCYDNFDNIQYDDGTSVYNQQKTHSNQQTQSTYILNNSGIIQNPTNISVYDNFETGQIYEKDQSYTSNYNASGNSSKLIQMVNIPNNQSGINYLKPNLNQNYGTANTGLEEDNYVEGEKINNSMAMTYKFKPELG